MSGAVIGTDYKVCYGRMSFGHGIEVTCVDIDQKNIDGPNGILPIYERFKRDC